MPDPISRSASLLLTLCALGTPALTAQAAEVILFSAADSELCAYDVVDGFACSDFGVNAHPLGDAGDLDGDGYTDFVSFDGDVEVCFSDADGTASFTCAALGLDETHAVNLADFDGDGDLDLISSQYETINVCTNDGSGSFSCADVYTSDTGTAGYAYLKYFSGLEVADLNGDAYPDLVAAGNIAFNKYTMTDRACLGSAAGTLSCSTPDPGTSRESVDAEAIDVDLDGDDDIVYIDKWTSAGNQLSQARLCVNEDGDGTSWSCSVIEQIDRTTRTHEFTGSDVADFDGDGIDDVFLASAGYQLGDTDPEAHSQLCFGDGDGGFTCEEVSTGVASGSYRYVGWASAPEAVDLDGDGDLDVVMAGGRAPVGETTGGFYCLNDGAGAMACDAFGTGSGYMYQALVGAFTEPDGETAADSDSDGDGVSDDIDLCASEDATGYDADGDGCLDDSDGDGFTDDIDAFPGDDSEWSDSDGDGTGDNADAFPTDASETADEDGDGVGNNADTCFGFPNDDTDGDDVCDSDDVCPTDATDADADEDGVCDVVELCVGDDAAGDTDGDQVCDDIDVCDGNDAAGDNDGDAVCDDVDNCPGDVNDDQADADGDGVGDECEADSDGDGIIDDDDSCPDDVNFDQSDNDGDGDGDACDDDDDGDGVDDEVDVCPFYPDADQADTDGDGFGDACDGDDDGDGVDDDDDLCAGTPLDAPFDDSGCSGEQRIELECGTPEDYSWRRSGQYIRCVVKESRAAYRAGLVTKRERAWLIKRATVSLWLSRYIQRIRRWC